MAGLRCGGSGKAALIAFVLGVLALSLIPTVAIPPSDRSPDSGPPASYTGLRPDWVRVPPLPSASPLAAIQPAPATPTEPPLATPSPVEPPPTVEAPPPTETIAIAGIAPPVVTLPPATAAPPPASPPPTESPPPPTEIPAPTSAPAVADGLDLAFAEAIVDLTNEVRVANGLNPLTEHPALVAAAQEYSDLHAHVCPDRLDHSLSGSTLGSRIESEGYEGWTLLAENLFWGSFEPPLPPAQAIDLWLASPSHRDNLMNPTLTEIGVGCYVSTSEPQFRICVQDFGAMP